MAEFGDRPANIRYEVADCTWVIFYGAAASGWRENAGSLTRLIGT